MEHKIITSMLNKLITKNNLPPVVFHSLRHSSITYKLKLNGGDMKSVQGDSGHAQIRMVADVYSHIIDDDRCINARRFEETFYKKKSVEPYRQLVTKTKTENPRAPRENLNTVAALLSNPDFFAVLQKAMADYNRK